MLRGFGTRTENGHLPQTSKLIMLQAVKKYCKVQCLSRFIAYICCRISLMIALIRVMTIL